MAETKVQREIMLDMSVNGHRGFRNNVGVLRDKTGAYVRYGLGNGTSDIIGFTSVEITSEMVGKRVAIFTAIEVKQDDKSVVRDNQEKFIALVRKKGGIAGLAWTVPMSRDLTDKIDLPDYQD